MIRGWLFDWLFDGRLLFLSAFAALLLFVLLPDFGLALWRFLAAK